MGTKNSLSLWERVRVRVLPYLALTTALILFLGLAATALADEAQQAATPGATPATASGVKGTIKGNVVNLTKGGGSVGGLDVNLIVFSGQNQSGKQTVKAGQDGKFSFEGIDTGQNFTYILHTQYQGVDYAAEPITFPADSTEQTAEVQVFDATSSDENVKSAARHYLLEVEPDGVNVSEIAIISNGGDKTYTGSKQIHEGVNETLRFALPEGAQDVEYGGGMVGSRVFPVDGGLVDTWPLYPGDTQRIFRYRIPANGDSISFTTKITSATAKVNLLVPDTGVGVTVTNLPNKSNPDIQGQKFVLFSGDNLAADTELQIKLANLPKAGVQGTAGPPSILPLIAGSGILVVVIVAFVVVMLVRRRRRPGKAGRRGAAEELAEGGEEEGEEAGAESDTDTEVEGEILEAEKRELVAAIARLDDDFEAEKLSAEEYGRLRAEKKRRLVVVVDRQKALAATRGDQ